ncbi:MAG: hypothetical protein FWH38_10615, partial [Treponema sp.]|nr:hypothetical protein [Treponema sp.]
MAVRFRIIFSFFLSALLLAGLALPGYTGIFELLDNNFYHPAVTEALIRETARDADVLNRLISDLESRFSASLGDPAVQNSFLPDQDAADIYQRSRIFGMLLESVSGLQSVRFIDANGMRVHFSTLQSDFLQSDLVSVVYRNYGEDASDLPFHDVYSAEGLRLIPDRVKGSLVFSFPFYDSLGINRGTALFSVSARALTEALATAGRIGSDENLVFCADPAGIVIGLSVPPDEKILAGLASAWAGRYRNIVPLAESDVSFSLVSVRMQSGLFYGRVVRDSVLLFPKPVKAIVLAAVFLTLFLLIFLILNVRRVPELSDREIAAPADPAPAPPGDTVLLSGAGGLPARAGEERRFDGPAAAGRDIESPRKTFTFFGVEEAEELEELAAADSEETACGAGKSG